MRALVLFFTLTLMALGNQYTFLVNKYDKEIELEAKIVSKIALTSLNKEQPLLYIPQISQSEKEIYSQFFKLSTSCDDANFVFVKKVWMLPKSAPKRTNSFLPIIIKNCFRIVDILGHFLE